MSDKVDGVREVLENEINEMDDELKSFENGICSVMRIVVRCHSGDASILFEYILLTLLN